RSQETYYKIIGIYPRGWGGVKFVYIKTSFYPLMERCFYIIRRGFMTKFNRNFKRTISSLMIFMMIITLIPLNVLAEERAESDIEKAIDNAANWLIENDEIDQWAVMDLARGNKEIPESYLNEFRNN